MDYVIGACMFFAGALFMYFVDQTTGKNLDQAARIAGEYNKYLFGLEEKKGQGHGKG